MDCRTARLLLDFARPVSPELEAPEAITLEAHLAGCSECASLACAERQRDDRLGSAMRSVPIPEGLRIRLLDGLDKEDGRDSRRRLHRNLVGLAAAAAIGFVAWLVLRGGGPLPHVVADLAYQDTILRQSSSGADAVDDWFQEKHRLANVAPRQLKDDDNRGSVLAYERLAYYGLDDFLGKRTPHLLFINKNGDFAHVYILSDTVFDLKDLKDEPGYNARVYRHPTDPRIAYLVLYTSENVDWLLFKTQSGRPVTTG